MLTRKTLVALLAGVGIGIAVVGGPPSLALTGSRWEFEALWFLIALLMTVPPISQALANSWDYVLALAVIGGPLALATLYHQLALPVAQRCEHCISSNGVALAIMVFALCSPNQETSLRTRLRADFRRLRNRSTIVVATMILAISWSGLSAAESLRIHKWLSMSDKVAVLGPLGNQARITVFSDFQCPACAAKHKSFDRILDALAESSSGKIVVDRLDFPLDSECNPNVEAVVHPAACEAAVLVRIAKDRGLVKLASNYLYEHHAELTPDFVRSYANRLGLQAEYESRYGDTIAVIRRDIELGAKVGIQGTPTYFVNGIQIDNAMPPALFASVVRAAAGL